MSEKRTIARNTLANSAAKFVQVVAAFIFMPWLIERFGLGGYGVFLLASSISVYIGLLDLGVGQTLVKYVAEHHAVQNTAAVRRMVSSGIAYFVVTGILASGALVALAVWGVDLFRLSADLSTLATQLFAVSAAITLVSWPLSIGYSLLNGVQRYDLSAAITIGVAMGNVIVTAIVLLAGWGPVALLAGMGVIRATGAGVSCLLAAGQLRGVRVSARSIDARTLRMIIGFGWMLFVGQVAVIAANEQTDRLILAAFTGAAAVTVYEAVSRPGGLIAQIASLPASALVPAASSFAAQGRFDSIRTLQQRAGIYTLTLVTPVAMALIVLAEALLRTWLGEPFASHALEARLLLLGWIVYANLLVPFTILTGTGQIRFMTAFNVATAVLNVVLSVILAPYLGVLGVVIGTVTADLVLFPLGMGYALKQVGVGRGEYLRTVAMRTYPYLVVTALVAWAGIALGATSTLGGVAAVGIAAVAAGWLAIIGLGLDRTERSELRSLARGALTRAD